MVKTILGILFTLCSLSVPVLALPQGDSPGSNAALDATGVIWAMPTDGITYGTLSRLQDKKWTAQIIPGVAYCLPLVLTRGDDGNVYVLWQKLSQGRIDPTQSVITVHRGMGSRILARITGEVVRSTGTPYAPRLYAGSAGDVWIAGGLPVLRHISPDGSLQEFPLKPEQFFGGKFPTDFNPPSFASLVDGAGRRWFWQGHSQLQWQPGSLRGVLLWNGRTLDYHPTLAGVPDHVIAEIAPLDTNHLWLATGNDRSRRPWMPGALYQVDTRTLTAAPEPSAFQNIQQVFGAGGDWYIADKLQFSPGTVLWHKQAGQWQHRLDNLEKADNYYNPDPRYSWLKEPTGTWLSANSGAWWLPRSNAPPIFVNWRRGLNVPSINGLFPLSSGRILAFGRQGAAEMPPTPQPVISALPAIVTGGLDAPRNLGPLLTDLRRHLWGTPTNYSGPCPLDEWDGTRWRTRLPPQSITGVSNLCACDSRGRLWLSTMNWHPPDQTQPTESYVVYDPAQDAWTSYASKTAALQAAANLPGMAFLPNNFIYSSCHPAFFSGDGRVAFADNTTVFLYDGKVWRHWASRDISPESGGGQPSQLTFTQGGHFEVALSNRLWDWSADGGWQSAGEQIFPAYENPVPPGGPPGLSVSPTVESGGAKWFVWQDAVYTADYGLWAKQNALSQPGSPFLDGRSLEEVLPDPAGHLFFVTRIGVYYDLVVWSPPPVPTPTLSVVPSSDDSVTVRFGTELNGSHGFLWRLNGGAWSAPTTENTLALTALARGNYRLEVEALDRHLQASAPATDVFTIQVMPETQITRWVRALLSGTDDEREAAVAGLVKQPEAARAALGAARTGAPESGRWWIDAALQQITDQAQAGTNEPR